MIRYELTRAKDKGLEIDVKNGRVRVSAPPGMPLREIDGIIDLHADALAAEVARQRLNPGTAVTPKVPEYELKRSERKTVGLEITDDMRVLVRAPKRMTRAEIDGFVLKYSDWITEHMQRAVQRRANYPEPDAAQRLEYIERARAELPGKVSRYSRMMGVTPAAITITDARKRFGSCSSAQRLSFSWRLMMYPEAAIDYVVVHELAHILHMDHSPAFYAEIARVLPDYKQRTVLLRGASGE